MNNIFPFVQLKSFQNGWRYSGKLKEFIKHKYYNSLVKINDEDIDKISDFLHGSLIKSKIFKNFAWVLYFNPVPKLQIYIFCERNSKTGDNFTIFFGKNSGELPVEDIYGFAVVYITLLALIGGKNELINKTYSLEEFTSISSGDKMYADIIRKRCLSSDLSMDKILKDLKNFHIIQDYSLSRNQVEFIVHPLKNVKMKFVYKEDSREVLISKESSKIFPSKLILSFTGLICNAIKREFGK